MFSRQSDFQQLVHAEQPEFAIGQWGIYQGRSLNSKAFDPTGLHPSLLLLLL